jgi:hypothetical protein
MSKIRSWGYRVLGCIDDFLVAPSVGRTSTVFDCAVASARIERLMDQLGIARHPTKGVRGEGAQVLDHLGKTWASVSGRYTLMVQKQEKIKRHAVRLLREACCGRRWVGGDSLRSFAGVSGRRCWRCPSLVSTAARSTFRLWISPEASCELQEEGFGSGSPTTP